MTRSRIQHPKSTSEFSKIISALKGYEDKSRNIQNIPTSFLREEERLKQDLQSLLDQQKKYRERFDLVVSRDKVAQDEFQRQKSMYMFLGHMQASMETFEKLIDGGELEKEISSLRNEYSGLINVVDPGSLRERIDNAAYIIAGGVLNHLKTLDVEDKYRRVAPRFSIRDLNISVLSNDGFWHFLAEVGSASNWVSFHIALICSLQEYFLDMDESCVPSFAIFDQPSQVYFPNLRRLYQNVTDVELDPRYDDEDVSAVKSIFKTITNSIIGRKGAWQCIILDHADSQIYGDIEGVHEVDEWRNGKKLIPKEWYA
ncbi:MAG: DUF3732 domain-containing protein [Bacilli bacterium]